MKPDKKKITKTLSQEEYERKIKELQDELEELKKVKIEEEKKPERGKIWKPEKHEDFFYLDEIGALYDDTYFGYPSDDLKLSIGNFYKTSEEAKHQLEVQKYTNLFRKYVEEHSEPLDWNNTEEKYFLIWNFYSKDFAFNAYCRTKIQGTVYSSSKQVLEDAIEFVGKDNVIKYVLGVD